MSPPRQSLPNRVAQQLNALGHSYYLFYFSKTTEPVSQTNSTKVVNLLPLSRHAFFRSLLFSFSFFFFSLFLKGPRRFVISRAQGGASRKVFDKQRLTHRRVGIYTRSWKKKKVGLVLTLQKSFCKIVDILNSCRERKRNWLFFRSVI